MNSATHIYVRLYKLLLRDQYDYHAQLSVGIETFFSSGSFFFYGRRGKTAEA